MSEDEHVERAAFERVIYEAHQPREDEQQLRVLLCLRICLEPGFLVGHQRFERSDRADAPWQLRGEPEKLLLEGPTRIFVRLLVERGGHKSSRIRKLERHLHHHH